MKSSILIVDDSPLICEIVSCALRDFDCNIIRAGSGAQAIEAVRAKETPDLVLLDVVLPDIDGYDICRIIKQNPLTSNIPVIFITSYIDSNNVVKGFEAGGVDYICKPFNNFELRARVKAHLTNKQMTDSMRVLNETLSHALLENRRLATEDPLTKLYNRRSAYENLARRFRSSNTHKMGLIIIDVDNFKQINDTYGHSAGDYVLCKIAAIIKEVAGKKGIVCRWGGEEFLVAITGSLSTDITLIGEKMCQRIRDTAFVFKRKNLKCSITVGIATAKNGESFETTLTNADQALYEGKNSGKDKCVEYRP